MELRSEKLKIALDGFVIGMLFEYIYRVDSNSLIAIVLIILFIIKVIFEILIEE